MPNRIIKDTICESKGLSEVSFFAADLYKRLLVYADDYGRFNADFQIILARLYPREIGLVTLDDIESAMTELAGVGKIEFYTSTARDELYGCLPKWSEHQRVRDSKKKIPEPDDVTVNDWYLRRFIPISMKIQIIERDKFVCQECGKPICAGVDSARRLVKMGAGLFHIDHIVPVNQGGRATLENLRLLCPSCNLQRQKHFSFDEILAFSRQIAANCGEKKKPASNCRKFPPNPIQSNPNPNPIRIQSESANDEDDDDDGFEEFWKAYPRKSGDIREAYFAYVGALQKGAKLSEMLDALKWQTALWAVEDPAGRYIPSPTRWLENRKWTEKKREPVKKVQTAADYDAATAARDGKKELADLDRLAGILKAAGGEAS